MRTFSNPIVVEKFYENLFDAYRPDIFVSTWDHIGKSQHDNTLNEASGINECEILNVYQNVKNIEIENFNAWLDGLNSDELKNLWAHYRVDNILMPTSIPQFYKIYRANELKCEYERECGFKYDIVIRYRPDLIMVDKLHLDANVESTIVNINTKKYHWPNRIYDIFFYSNSENINKMCEVWPNFISVLNHPFTNGLPNIDPCRMLYVQALINNINVQSMDKNICDVYRNESYECIRSFLLD